MQLNLELHMRKSMKLRSMAPLAAFSRHVVREHGFRIFRGVPHTGWAEHPPTLIPTLWALGFKEGECCYNLHMVREPGKGTRVCE